MRLLFSLSIAFLLTMLAAVNCSAMSKDNPCHGDGQMVASMDMESCICSHGHRSVSVEIIGDTPEGTECCHLERCREVFVPKGFALVPALPLVEFSGFVQNPSFFQPQALTLYGADRTGLPPPLLPSAPAFIQHCSFLI